MTAINPPVHLFSTLPHVLEEYIPDYKPKREARPSPSRSGEFDETLQEKQEPSKDEKQKKQSEGVTEELKPAYSGHSRKHRLSEEEHHEQLSQRWDEAKLEVRSSNHEKLKEKIELQRLLIRRQDVLAQQKRDKIRQDIEQKRDSDKAKRQQREAALQEKCKASLEEDRKAIQERQNKTKEVRISQGSANTAVSPTSPDKAVPRHGSFQPALPPLSRTPSNLEFNDTDKTKPWTPSSLAELEWYQSQLYQMFGNEADTFLHPKMEQQVKKPTNPKLAKQGGRAGAERLWDTLRKESIIRLLKEDAHIEQDLKDTYSAFVRESIGTNRKIVRRNFYAHDDVPELRRLLDQSQLNAVRTNKHKVDIMYRASVNNMDRTNILTHNFPLPLTEEGDVKKESCVARYLPSWMDDASEVTVPEYTKWLPRNPQEDIKHPEDPSENKENRDPWKKEEVDDELLLLMTRSRKHVPQPKYVFLTEKEARVKGKFADKFKDEREYKDIPRPYMGGAKSVMGATCTPATADKRAESAPLPQKHVNNYETFLTPWEPLSMKALVEYKTQLDTPGDGEFNQGRTKTWKTEVKAT